MKNIINESAVFLVSLYSGSYKAEEPFCQGPEDLNVSCVGTTKKFLKGNFLVKVQASRVLSITK